MRYISGNGAKLSLLGCLAKVKSNINVFVSINISGLPVIDPITLLIINFDSFNSFLTHGIPSCKCCPVNEFLLFNIHVTQRCYYAGQFNDILKAITTM